MNTVASEFGRILTLLLDPDNNVRRAAEDQLNNYPPDLRVLYLFNTFQVSPELKTSALVTLRSQISKLNDEHLKTENIQRVKIGLLEALRMVTDENLLTKLCSVVTKLNSRFVTTNNEFSWNELVSMVNEFLLSNDVRKFAIVFKIIRDDPYLFGENTENIAPTLLNLFTITFNHAASNPSLCMEALDAYSSISDEISSKELKNSFMNLAPLVISASRELFKHNETKIQTSSLLAMLLEAQSWLFSNHVYDILFFLLETLNEPDSNDENQEFNNELFECVLSICEHMSSSVRKNASNLIPQILLYSFKLMMKINEDEVKEWIDNFSPENDNDEDHDYYENASYGETSLDRLCLALKGKAVYNNIWDIIKSMQASSADWRVRYASVASIGCISEGCKRNIKNSLAEMTGYLVERLTDTYPKVVYAAINSIGQLATDFETTYVKQFHSQIIPPILHVSVNNNFVKVRAQAIIAFINMMDGMDDYLWSQYNIQINDTIMKILQEQCINIEDFRSLFIFSSISSALIAMAEKYDSKFVEFLPAYNECLLKLASKLLNPLYVQHLGKILSTCIQISNQVGAAAFIPYSERMVKLIQFYYNSINNSNRALRDNYTMQYLTLVSEFSSLAPQYIAANMNHVIPILISYLQEKPDIKVVENSQAPENNPENYSSIKIDDDNSIVYRNDITGDIEQACTVINTIADNANHALLPYIEQLLQVMDSQCSQSSFSAIQTAITSCFSTFIKISALKSDEYCRKFFTYSVDRLKLLMENMDDFEVCASFVTCLSDSFCAIKSELVLDNELIFFGQQILILLNQVIKEEQEISDSNNDLEKDEYGFDDDFERELIQELLDEIQLSVGEMMKRFGPRFFVPFEILLPALLTIIDKFIYSKVLRSYAFAQLCDLVEHSKPLLLKYHSSFIPRIIDNISSNDPDIRQSCSFSIGVLASHQIPEFIPLYLTRALNIFSDILMNEKSKDPEFSYANANCIASVGRLIKFAPNIFENNLNDAITHWFNLLPVVEDEVDFILSFVNDLIKNNSDIILRNPRIDIQHVFMVLCVMIVEASSTNIIKESLDIIQFLKNNDPVSFNNTASKLEAYTISRLEDLFKSIA